MGFSRLCSSFVSYLVNAMGEFPLTAEELIDGDSTLGVKRLRLQICTLEAPLWQRPAALSPFAHKQPLLQIEPSKAPLSFQTSSTRTASQPDGVALATRHLISGHLGESFRAHFPEFPSLITGCSSIELRVSWEGSEGCTLDYG